MVLVFLPIITFIALFISISGRRSQRQEEGHWIGDFLITCAIWGVFVTISSELLSLFDALNRLWLAGLWTAAIVVTMAMGRPAGLLKKGIACLRREYRKPDPLERIGLILMAGIAAILFAIAVISPPNNADSAIYHMSRVVHWAQNQSLRHYPAYVNHQLLKPIWAESAILHMRILWGGDRVANLVQWFSMFASLIGVAGIARLLGAGRKGQLLAAFFVISIPMGILQSSSTQNDYVAAFWVVGLAYFVVLSMRRDLSKLELSSLAFCFGLGVLTKGTFFVYFPPLLGWYFLRRLQKGGIKKVLLEGTFMLLVVSALNFGFWARNMVTFGGPYGSPDWLQRNLGIDIDFFNRLLPDEPTGGLNQSSFDGSTGRLALVPPAVQIEKTKYSIAQGWTDLNDPTGLELPGFLSEYPSDLARTIARNFTSPFGFITQALVRFVETFPGLFGPTLGDELLSSAWNHEDHAGNLHHLLLVPISIVLLLPSRRDSRSLVVAYSIVILATYMLLPIVIGHADSFWGVRYQLPFFVLWGPVFGYAVARFERSWLTALSFALLALASLPWLVFNNIRPLIGMPPWPTKIESILVASQPGILLANNPGLVDDFTLTANAILESDCRSVGLRIDREFLEYPIWWLLDAPQSGIRLELVNVSARWAPYIEDFNPCAVVCTICGDKEEFRGLSRAGEFDSIILFLNPESGLE